MFDNEPTQQNGKIKLNDNPGWGLTLNRKNLIMNRVSQS
jgi:L-alanine-DL-glutamate epimerase-like enolase superfamily enzyme